MSPQTTGQPARRICHLNLARNFRGGQRQTELLIRALAERGVPQRALVAADGALRARLDDVPDLELRPVGKPHWRHLRHTRGCLVHSNGGSALTLAWLSWKLQGTPYIFTRRINKPIKGNPVSRAKYRGARHIANVCRLAQTTLLEALPGVPSSVVYSVTAGFAPDPARVAALRAQWGERYVLVNVAALNAAQKGQPYLIEAARQLADSAPQLHFVLCGGGPDEAALRTQAQGLTNVEFHGHVENVGDYLAAADAFIFPSLSEGLGTTLLDAMKFDLPVISTGCDGIPEIVRHEDNGLLVPTRDAQALASAAQRLAGDPALAQRLAAAGARFAADFVPARMAAQYLAIYDAVLADVDAG